MMNSNKLKKKNLKKLPELNSICDKVQAPINGMGLPCLPPSTSIPMANDCVVEQFLAYASVCEREGMKKQKNIYKKPNNSPTFLTTPRRLNKLPVLLSAYRSSLPVYTIVTKFIHYKNCVQQQYKDRCTSYSVLTTMLWSLAAEAQLSASPLH